MSGRSAKYAAGGGGPGPNSRSGSPPPGGYPPMPAISSSYGSVYDGPGNIPLMGGGPPPPRPPSTGPPPPMIGVEGAPAGPSPYSGLDKRELWLGGRVSLGGGSRGGSGGFDFRFGEWGEGGRHPSISQSPQSTTEASRKVVNMPPYSSLNNKREAPAYEELINFPRAKDKDEMRCVMCGHPPSEACVIPRQNKDVCKECDKSTWLHISTVRSVASLLIG